MRRIKSARISFISLVPRGANRIPVLYKSEDQTAQFDCLVKDDRFAEHGELTAVVYAPETTDSQGDIASATVIKQMAHDYVRNIGSVDVQHDTRALPREKVTVVESFIIQKNDSRFTDLKDYSGRPVDATGGWGVVIKVDDPELRRLYREGHWNGVSMFGPAIVEPIAKSAGSIADALAQRLGGGTNNDTKENDMDIKELEAALAKSNDALATKLADTIVAGLAKALKPEPAGDKQTPTTTLVKFEGDPTNLDEIRAHKAKLRASLVKWDDPKSVEAYEASLLKEAQAAEAAAKGKEEGKGNEGKSAELMKAEAELAKAQAELVRVSKGSNQGKEEGKGGNSDQLVEATGLKKADVENFAIGRRMAAFVNGTPAQK